jgi:hypothetical protein
MGAKNQKIRILFSNKDGKADSSGREDCSLGHRRQSEHFSRIWRSSSRSKRWNYCLRNYRKWIEILGLNLALSKKMYWDVPETIRLQF